MQQLWYTGAPQLLEKNSKSLIHSFTFANYSGLAINPYQGCAHRCAYCYATYEWSPEFYDKIYAKSNAAEVLDGQLAQWKSELIGPVMVGSATDAYQPAELKYGLTKKCIEVLQKHNVPYYVFTKSAIVERDVELHARYKENCAVMWSITTANEKVRRVIEPGTPPSSRLFNAISRMSKRGVACGVNVDPIIPLVTDSLADLIQVVNLCKDAGVKHVFGSVLRLRGDIWARVQMVLKLLNIPDWQQEYSKIYDTSRQDANSYGMASESYQRQAKDILYNAIDAAGLDSRFPDSLGKRRIKRAKVGQSSLQDFFKPLAVAPANA